MTGIKVVQYGRVEHYAVLRSEDSSLSANDIDVIYEHGKPVRFVLNHKTELDMDQVSALLRVLRMLGINPEGDEKK